MEIIKRGQLQSKRYWNLTMSGKVGMNLNLSRLDFKRPMDIIPKYNDIVYSSTNRQLSLIERGYKTNPNKVAFVKVDHSRHHDFIHLVGDSNLRFMLADVCCNVSEHYCGAMHLVLDNRNVVDIASRPQLCGIDNVKVPCGVRHFRIQNLFEKDDVFEVKGTHFRKCICSREVMTRAEVRVNDQFNSFFHIPIFSFCAYDHLTVIINHNTNKHCKICGFQIQYLEASEGFTGGPVGKLINPKNKTCLMCSPWREICKEMRFHGYKFIDHKYHTEQLSTYLSNIGTVDCKLNFQLNLLEDYNKELSTFEYSFEIIE
uniref:NSP1 n=1 Tax=Crocidura shantungensis seadorna-like virus 2 TaxID=3139546 RepID=A0AB38ZK52_9REOV